jgi:hypothetical protein
MARQVGASPATVRRIWAANGIKPHLTRTFKLSRDPHFEAKFWDVIGLYLHPPDKALVLCCDEKSQCQALERTQPGLPLGLGHIRTRTHDYIRHATVTLFAALNYLDGRILSTTAPRHTHLEWLAFLKRVHRKTPPGVALHLIVDNYATHKHPVVALGSKNIPACTSTSPRPVPPGSTSSNGSSGSSLMTWAAKAASPASPNWSPRSTSTWRMTT